MIQQQDNKFTNLHFKLTKTHLQIHYLKIYNKVPLYTLVINFRINTQEAG